MVTTKKCKKLRPTNVSCYWINFGGSELVISTIFVTFNDKSVLWLEVLLKYSNVLHEST